jgi:hypothetical protein
MRHRLIFVWSWIAIGSTSRAGASAQKVPEFLLCMAASSAAQHNLNAGEPKRFQHKEIFRTAQVTRISSAPAMTNMFAALPNFAQ